MEVLRVPITVGLTSKDAPLASFYSVENTLQYSPQTYPYQALLRANNQECQSTDEPCAHVIPEVWGGQRTEYLPLVKNQTIDPVTANGLLGKGSLYIPAFTAKQYGSVSIFYGLQGEENRKLLADIFKRPTTWLQYCQEVSPTNCSSADDTASRFPSSQGEESMYFLEGQYQGYFRATNKNNCTANPDTCTGHVTIPPCHWSTNVEAQLFHNNIVGLESDGLNPPNAAYSYGQMQQVWRAANATKSHVLMHWWQPEALIVDFLGTDAAFTPIFMPIPTATCLKHRVDVADKCSMDLQKRLGDPRGACDDEAQPLQRVIAATVSQTTEDTDEVDRSPVLQFLRNVKLSDLDMTAILETWRKQHGKDRFGNDAREAVCLCCRSFGCFD